MKKLLSINDVAKALDIPKSTIRYWCFTKKIRYYKIGRHLKFDEKDVKEYIESNLVEEGNDGCI